MRTRQKVKIRKSTRYFYIICIMSLIIVLSSSLIQNLLKNNTIKKKEEIYSYTNEFNYNYDVNLINNKYIDQKTLQMNEVYVTDLIDNIHLNINYDYTQYGFHLLTKQYIQKMERNRRFGIKRKFYLIVKHKNKCQIKFQFKSQ